MKQKQTGIFSGSFNPIHNGHLMLANYIVEYSNLDEIWFVVTPQNPLKEPGLLLDDGIRLQMTQLAVQGFEKFRVSDIEFSMPKPSYTIDTLNRLSQENPDTGFTLIIGADSWNDIHKWKSHQEMIEKYKVMVYPRLGYDITINENQKQNVAVVEAPVVEVSSTFVRKSIREGKEVKAFVPLSVYDFVIENQLYQ